MSSRCLFNHSVSQTVSQLVSQSNVSGSSAGMNVQLIHTKSLQIGCKRFQHVGQKQAEQLRFDIVCQSVSQSVSKSHQLTCATIRIVGQQMTSNNQSFIHQTIMLSARYYLKYSVSSHLVLTVILWLFHVFCFSGYSCTMPMLSGPCAKLVSRFWTYFP